MRKEEIQMAGKLTPENARDQALALAGRLHEHFLTGSLNKRRLEQIVLDHHRQLAGGAGTFPAREEGGDHESCDCVSWARVQPIDLRGFPHHSQCPRFKKTYYVRVKLIDGGSYHCHPEDLGPLMVEIQEAVEGEDAGVKWEVELVEMSPMEFALLPDFEGH